MPEPISSPAPEAVRQPTPCVDSDHPEVIRFASEAAVGADGPRELARRLFERVRDSVRYDPYRVDVSVPGLSASRCLETGHGFCVSKAALLAAVARARGLPARLGFADVRNHLNSDRLRAAMGTDLFVFHGYAELYLDDRWVKLTPAFNRSLCDRLGVPVLEFDGFRDAMLQPHDREGRVYLEYVRDRGSWSDVPVEAMAAAWKESYPTLFESREAGLDGDFEADAASGV